MGIYRRGRVYWGRWRVGGELRRVSLGTDNADAAQERLEQLRYEEREALGLVEPGDVLDSWYPPESFGAGVLDWLDQVEAGRRPSTRRTYRSHARRWLLIPGVFLGARPLQLLSTRDVREWQQRILTIESRVQVRFRTRVLLAFLGWCVDTERLDSLPRPARITGIDQSRPLATLSPEQIETLYLAATASPDLRVVLALGLEAGLRRCETLALRWEDVDLDNGTLSIRPYVGFSPKSGQTRVIPLTNFLWGELKNHPRKNQYVITKRDNWLAREIAALWRATKTPTKQTLHALRHTFATRLVASGADLETIRELLGHSSIMVTSRYLHTDDSRKRAAIAGI